jgi:hypothetical protein
MNFELKKYLPHILAIGLFWLLAAVYYYPAMQGYRVKQGDISQHKGMSHEIESHKVIFGEDPLWQGNMFAGMPSYQTSRVEYDGNIFSYVHDGINALMSIPISVTFLYMIGFYILLTCLRISPLIAVFGAIAFGFSSYFFIIIEAGHNSKAFAIAYMAPVIGGFILAYRSKPLLGALIVAFFMSIEIYVNHLQVTYYLGLLVIALGIYFLIDFVKSNRIKEFIKISSFLILGLVIALMANIGNLYSTYEYSKVSTRGKSELTIAPKNAQKEDIAKNGLDRDYITRWSYGKEETFSLLIPDAKGPGSGAILGDQEEVERLRAENPTFFNYIVNEYQKNGNIINTYWGDQPGTSGSVYIGAIVFLLAFLAMFFVKNSLKWPIFAIAILAILLSWGKNLMWFTDIFIDYFPMYNKFRAVTIIMVLVELAFPFLAALFLHELVSRKDEFIGNQNKLYKFIGGFLLVFLVISFTPDSFLSFTSTNEEIQFTQQSSQAPQSIDASRNALIDYRIDIFQSSAFGSLKYILLAVILLVLFLKDKLQWKVVVVSLTALVLIDLWVNDKRYVNNEKTNAGEFVSWDKKEKLATPYVAGPVDNEIFKREFAKNPNLQQSVQQNIGIVQKETGKVGRLSQSETESVKFSTLMRGTHYRVLNTTARLDADAQTAYFHKTLGGYHGAKMKKYQELIDFHLGQEQYTMQQAIAQGGKAMAISYLPQMNIINMLNAKYVIGVVNSEQGQSQVLIENQYANGNAWFVNELKVVSNADSAILALDKNDLKNSAIAVESNQIKSKQYSKNSGDFIKLESYLPNKLKYTYSAASDQFGVFSEIYYNKGWKAFLNGKELEILEVNYLLRGLQIPSGKGEIEFVFEPYSYSIGSTFAYISTFLLLGCTGGLIYYNRKKVS